jgi:hypothetical protein
LAGPAANFERHPAEQKKYGWPSCAAVNAVPEGLTIIPQTGSFVGMFVSFGRAPQQLSFSASLGADDSVI